MFLGALYPEILVFVKSVRSCSEISEFLFNETTATTLWPNFSSSNPTTRQSYTLSLNLIAIKLSESVYDCLVVGLDDEKFGQRVVAVVSLNKNSDISEQDLTDFTKTKISGYKAPKNILFVDEVKRAPNGKANYKWAKAEAIDKLS